MKKVKKLFESKQVGKLYHYTNLDSLEKILHSNRMGLTSEEQKELEILHFQYMSSLSGDFESQSKILPPPSANLIFFSRTPNNKVYKEKPVLIILDGDKLSENYKIKDSGGIYQGKIENEIYVPKIIKNIKKYIIDIIVKKDALYNYFWGWDVEENEFGQIVDSGEGEIEKFKNFLKKNRVKII